MRGHGQRRDTFSTPAIGKIISVKNELENTLAIKTKLVKIFSIRVLFHDNLLGYENQINQNLL